MSERPTTTTADGFRERLSEVERRCAAADRPLVGSRRRVMELLLQADKPVKAYDLLARYSPRGPSTTPPIIYRALHALRDEGLVHQVVSLNAFVACGLEYSPHQAGFVICNHCGTTLELDVDELRDEIGRGQQFHVTAMVVEARGLCAMCRAKR